MSPKPETRPAAATEAPRDFELDGIVPWGRRMAEYRAFFDLDNRPAGRRILDVGAGPASFAAEATAAGLTVTALDPLYRFGGDAIRRRATAVAPAMTQGLERARDRFVWDFYGSREALLRTRQEALEIFLEDYEWGRTCGRYRAGALPDLPFADRQFDLALCSHLLFLYGDRLDRAFHLAALEELLRVAPEVRVFPLHDLEGRRSAHLDGIVAALRERGIAAEERPVAFEFQRNATTLLRLTVR